MRNETLNVIECIAYYRRDEQGRKQRLILEQ